MTVRKLSSHVRSQLQSGLTITDATQCTLELVENSLDAKATAIAVRVNLSEFSIEVVDNGVGISSEDLKLIGKRYMTSKCHEFDDLKNNFITYGYRGQALASIAETCGKLVIKTKYKMNKETMMKIFRNGEPPSLFVSTKEKSEKGTTVTVHGFMCTMPVRRQRISEVFDLQDIKNQMEYLAIIHNEVCFTLRDENKGEILLQTHKKTDAKTSLRDLFSLASDKFFKSFSYKEKNITVEGYISLKRHFESNLKFFYVNNRIVLKSMVHKFVDLCIDKYFKEHHEILQEATAFDGINLNLPKNNYNVYIVKVYCPYTHFVMFRNLRKTAVEFKDWDIILTCIKRAIKSALSFKSDVTDLEKIDKIRAPDCKRVAPKNKQAVGNLKNGIKGGLVRREFHCENLIQGRKNENLRHCTEGVGVGQNNISGCYKLSKLELINSSESHASGYNDEPRILSQSPVPKENYLNAKENAVLSDLVESVPDENINSVECTDFLDFLAWFGNKIKHNSKIYNYFKYKHNFRNLKINICTDEVDRKFLKYISLVNKIKRKGVRKRKEEGNKKEIKNSTLLRKSKKTRTTLVKQPGNDKMKGSNGTKRNNCAQNSVEFTSKKLKVGMNVGNNSSEDLVPAKLQNSPRNALSGSWFSHQNRLNLDSETEDVEMKDSRHVQLNNGESKTRQTFGHKKIRIKHKKEAQSRDNIRKGAEVTSKRKNLEYKDFGVQTDKDFAITPYNNEPNVIHSPSLNVISAGLQCEMNSPTFKDNVVNRPTTADIINEQACRKAKASSSPSVISSLQLNNLKIAAQELIPFALASKNTETILVTDSDMFCERLSNKLSHGTASEKLTDFPKMSCGSATVSSRSQSKLVHTDPLYVNSRNRTASLERCASHSTFTFTERYNFMPKGLSQSALDRSPVNDFETQRQNSDFIQTSVLPVNTFNLSEGSGHKSMLPCNILVKLQKKTDENMIYYEKELITASVVNKEAEIFSLGTVTIDKEELSHITVMGQWDKKFILAAVDVISSKKKKFLAIFDQHAVHERIMLEKLLREYRTSDGHFVSVCYDPPIKCTVKESVGRLLPSFENKLADYGIKASVIDHENVLLHEIPLCFTHESILEKAESFFPIVLNSIVEEFNETRGTIPGIPKVYYDVISTRACKSAVKFNDVLSNSAMKKMMNDLVTCQIPFQCAHGRPCVVPILDIEDYKRQFKREEIKLNFMKFSTSNPSKTE